MTPPQPYQPAPVRIAQSATHLTVAAPLPGLEPRDILVGVAAETVTIRAARCRQPDDREVLAAEWAAGPYGRDLRLPQPVDGRRATATYGAGVLVLALPKLAPGQPVRAETFYLEVLAPGRGEPVGPIGRPSWVGAPAEARPAERAARRAGLVLISARGDGAGRPAPAGAPGPTTPSSPTRPLARGGAAAAWPAP
jgi:HSP20 family protein